MKLGIICPSEIALRRFMPALQLVDNLEYVGLGVCSEDEFITNNNMRNSIVTSILKSEYEKAEVFKNQYGGKIFKSYKDIVYSNEIDVLYIPLPPAMHFKWAKLAIESGKHVIIEKPATTSKVDTENLINLAKTQELAVHENYMFVFHRQIEIIDSIIKSGEIGDIRLYRISFGFPLRSVNDFRYNKILGGGALIDAGGYTLKYASKLLGDSAKIKYAQMNTTSEYDVDMYGSAALVNSDGITAQIAFGMDNDYKCELEVWGSKGCLVASRVLTAPVDFAPTVVIKKNNNCKEIKLPCDDTFKKSIEHFLNCINNKKLREKNYVDIIKQAKLVDDFISLAK